MNNKMMMGIAGATYVRDDVVKNISGALAPINAGIAVCGDRIAKGIAGATYVRDDVIENISDALGPINAGIVVCGDRIASVWGDDNYDEDDDREAEATRAIYDELDNIRDRLTTMMLILTGRMTEDPEIELDDNGNDLLPWEAED